MSNYWLKEKENYRAIFFSGEKIITIVKAEEIIRSEGKIKFKFCATPDDWVDSMGETIDGFRFVMSQGEVFKKANFDNGCNAGCNFVLHDEIVAFNFNYNLEFPEDMCKGMDIFAIVELFYQEQLNERVWTS